LARHIFLGVGAGIAVVGAVVATSAVMIGAYVAITGTAVATTFGASLLQAFALGSLAVDAFAFIWAPVLGVDDMEGIEYEPSKPIVPSPNAFSHPAL